MRRHVHMLLYSLVLFAMGIACQLYNVFYPNEPYMQQMSFMFVAMPSVLAIISHYYHRDQPIPSLHQQQPLLDSQSEHEEKQSNSPNTGSCSASTHNHVLNHSGAASNNHVAATSHQSQRPRGKTTSRDFTCNDDGTDVQFGEFN